MDRVYISVIMVLILMIIGSGCSKRPIQEINEVTSFFEAMAPHENARMYAKEEMEQLTKDLTKALNEVKKQDRRIFIKDYDKSREMLVKVMAEVKAVAALISQRKDEEQKKRAMAAQNEAEDAIEDLKSLLEMASGKLPKGQVEIFSVEIKGLEDSMNNAHTGSMPMFMNITNNSRMVKQKAESLSTQIEQRLRK